MRKGAIALTLVCVVVAGAAVVGSRACSKPEKGSPSAESSASSRRIDVAAALREGRASPSAQAIGSAASTTSDAGSNGVDLVFSAPWGGERLDQVGRSRPSEANPEGPMSMTVDGQGRVYVLDQVNNRIVRRGIDGKPEAAIPIQASAAQDLAVAGDGSTAVLDRLSSKSVAIYDAGGAYKGELPLEGEGVEEPGLLTGVFVDGNDVYVEREHGPLVKLGDTSGVPAEPRTEIPGRPSRDGLSFLKAGLIEPSAGRAYVSSIERATMQHRFTRELRVEAPIQSIVLLDTDKSGEIYFAMQVERAPGDEVVFLTCLEPTKGLPIGTAVMPANTLPEETFRDLAVLDEGGVVYALRTEAGVQYQRYDCE